jgi:hypothetical protein
MRILLPNSGVPRTPFNNKNTWHELTDTDPFIKNIKTIDVNQSMDAASMNAMVSGIPSPWARARLFHSAFEYVIDGNIQDNGLRQFCTLLIKEWKGLLGLLAIHSTHIKLKTLILDPNAPQNGHLDLKRAMGNMLFNDIELWNDKDCNPIDALPIIQLIYCHDVLVGFVSPYTLIGTAAEYKLPNEITWFRNGKLDDPTEHIQNDETSLKKLYLLAQNIKNNLLAFSQTLIPNNPQYYTNINNALVAWLFDIQRLLGNPQNVLQGTLDNNLEFITPYDILFKIQQWIYEKNDSSFTRDPISGKQKFQAKDLLLDSKSIAEFEEIDEDKLAVHYLEVIDKSGKKRFFALPLSHLGLKIFENMLTDILPPNQKQHTISGEINNDVLTISLSLSVDTIKQTPIKKEYNIERQVGKTPNCILWPNFYSVYWTQYYFYSELPRNTTGFKIYPYFRNVQKKGNNFTDELFTKQDSRISLAFEATDIPDSNIKNLISYPVGRVDSYSHKYELIRSNKPIAGIEIRVDKEGSEISCGIIPLKKGRDDANIEESNHKPINKRVVNVGIDFGSNNTCISYYSDGEIKPLLFKNRRIFLIGKDVIDERHEKLAKPHELLFFQNEEPHKGQIKSWIQKPQTGYPSDDSGAEFTAGNPVFEPNIDVRTMGEFIIVTNDGFNIEHNLKWQNDEDGMTSKQGFMKTLFMKICAELYNVVKPSAIEFKWAYPSALSDKAIYKVMYDNMIDNIPIVDDNGKSINITVADPPTTESQAVCNYAVNNVKMEFNTNSMMIGIDVGGSTSDILLVAKINNAHSLIQQTSARLAAGKLATVIEKSKTFSQTVSNFIETNDIPIQGIKNNSYNENKAPYFLNALFDRLEDSKDFARFYKSIYQNHRVSNGARPVFIIPVFITGALIYYSGQLIRYAIDNNEDLNGIKNFTLYTFGKGGRLFDWLGAIIGDYEASIYYEQCLKAGIGKSIQDFNFTFGSDNRDKIKLEVSEGLLNRDIINHTSNSKVDLVGEEGIKFKSITLNQHSVISKEHFKELGAIDFPEVFNKFNEFLNIFLQVIDEDKGNFLGNTYDNIKDEIPNIGKLLSKFINTDRQYRRACENMNKFGYSQPIFILTAMSFLDEVIIPLVQKETA